MATPVSSHDDSIARIVILVWFKVCNPYFCFPTQLRTVKYISVTLVVLLLLVLATAYAVFNSNTFQNYITTKLGSYLSAQFKTKISIGHINYKPLHSFELENVLFGDHKNDTLFFAGKLEFNLVGLQLDSTKFKLSNVKLTDGYCHLKFYKDGSFNIDILTDPLDTLPSTGPPFVLFFDKVEIHNTRFRLVDETDTSTWENFNPSNQYFYDINGTAEQFFIIDDSLHFNIPHLALKEQGGFVANHIGGVATISPQKMVFEKMLVNTPTSTIGNYFSMSYKDWSSFGNFYDDVKMEAKIYQTTVDMTDVIYFASALKELNYVFRLNGSASGTVSNLKIKNVDLHFGKSGKFKGNADLNGLPDIDNTFIDAKVKMASFTKSDLEYITQQKLPNELAKFGTITFKGNYTGFYKDFVANGQIASAMGNIQSDINMKLADKTEEYAYSGNLGLTDFNIGEIVGTPLLGKLTVNAQIMGTGLTFESVKVEAKANISYIECNGYQYKNITLDALLANKNISTQLAIADENIALDFNGNINLAPNIPEYTFRTNVQHGNLKQLGIYNKDISVSFGADVKFSWKDIDHNNGTIDINKLQAVYKNEDYEVDKISLLTSTKTGSRNTQLITDSIDASIVGNFNFEELLNSISNSYKQQASDYFGDAKPYYQIEQNFTFNVNIKTLYPFNKILFDSVELSQAIISGKYNNQKQRWQLQATAKQFVYYNFAVNNLNINHQKDTTLKLFATATALLLNDTIITTQANTQINMHQGKIFAKVFSSDSLGWIGANMQANFNLKKDTVEGFFNPSNLAYRQSKFNINTNSKIKFFNEGIIFDEFLINRGFNESVLINGKYGFNNEHNLQTNITKIRLNILNQLIPSLNIKTDGEVTGIVNLQSKTNDWILGADINIDNLSLDNDTIGNYKLVSNYIDTDRRLMMLAKSTEGKLRNLQIGGYYDFKHPDDALHFSINFEESDITSFQAFVKDYLKLYNGSIKANGQLTGSINKPELVSTIDLMGVTLMVDYLKTMYSFSSTININEQNIKLIPTTIRDINDKTATLVGQIKHSHFSKFVVALTVSDLAGFQLLNTTSKDNDLFYGTAYATGNLSLTGAVDDLLLDGKFTTNKGTLINIPMIATASDGDNGLIHFINKDTLNQSATSKRSGAISGFTINCMVKATPDAEIQIVMDEQQGDKIRGRGKGDIKIELTRSGQFNMYGEVVIEEGDYKFTAMNLFSKKFTLKKGGTIGWTGDPLAGIMDITGVYNLRTSVSELVAVATQEEKQTLAQQRVPVECLLYVKGNLLNPDIKFDINFVDLNGVLSGNAASELQNTVRLWRNDNEIMTQQVISLMLFGRFAPTNIQNTASVPGISTGVNNTLSGFVSSQATNFIQQLIPGLDVNVDYHSGAEDVRGRTILSASKKVLDNRLEFQASFDPINPYQNFTTQYNLTRDGNLKLKAFSRGQYDITKQDNVNTGGLGLYYRKEFDKLQDMFKSKKKIVNNL